jgi:hypothetical protein
MSSSQRKLLKLFKGLGAKDQDVLIAFAEFLNKREGSCEEESQQELSLDPIPIGRPEEESVVAAIKRLSSSYHMLDTSTLLTETSSLMTAHLIHGRPASDVIDELEALFTQEYETFIDNSSNEKNARIP